jgi:hypothetical protein
MAIEFMPSILRDESEGGDATSTDVFHNESLIVIII